MACRGGLGAQELWSGSNVAYACGIRGSFLMRLKHSTSAAADLKNKKNEIRRLLEESGDVAPVDFQKYAKRAAEVITRAVQKAHAPGAQKVRR
jgi:hypothetical protein